MTKTKEPKMSMSTKNKSAHDPLISQLFDSSLGPTQSASTPRHRKEISAVANGSLNNTDPSPAPSVDVDGAQDLEANDLAHTSLIQPLLTTRPTNEPRRGRKRDRDDDDIEGRYMQRLDAEESKMAEGKDAGHVNKRQKLSISNEREDNSTSPASDPSEDGESDAERDDSSGVEVPQHESLGLSREQLELEKSSRTVFLGNVSTSAIKSKTAKKALLDHLISFSSPPSSSDKPYKVESLRFRSTPFASGVGPKKAAYAKKELMDTTAKSTNAYVVYTTSLAARETVKRLNGTTVLDRHLLVDSVAHPRKTDHRRCVFVGNLGFVDDDSQINAAKAEQANQKPRKRKEPSDIEEGLWRQFGKAGSVESVRVVRDANTRVGKGFAYVQFEDEVAMEKALAYNEKRFPPLLPRILRVTRAKKMTKNTMTKPQPGKRMNGTKTSQANYVPKLDPAKQSLSGRAGKLFGRAGAAHLKDRRNLDGKAPVNGAGKIVRTPEQIVFEGYRASSKQGQGAKIGGPKKKQQGKPGTRSSRRGAAFKAKGGRKVGK
ncbi:MAG: hypothetical protein Q9169_007199 [Polycauliona sp. 2 TL-2023]